MSTNQSKVKFGFSF